MDNLLTSSELAIRMARVHTPEHQIALMLGLSLKTLRTLHGPSMQRAIITADLEIRETLFAMAKSGKHAAATIFWFKTHSTSRTEKQFKPKQTVRTEMPPYGLVRFIGPNGEIVT